MITVHLSEEALQDLSEGFWFYEAQEFGLGHIWVTIVRLDNQ